MSSPRLRIATRKSPLAVWQAEHVARKLKAEDPGLSIELVRLTTKGDRILDRALSSVGGKDLFVKEIEQALFDDRADIAVHSLKDVPTSLPDGLTLTAFPPRGDPRDAVVSSRGYTFSKLPREARVGTCSLRRAAQLLRRRPDLQIVPIRGNVQTRLKKMEAEGMDATLLAYAGLRRLGLEMLATEVLDPEVCLPAIGQGILAVEARTDDGGVVERTRALDDPQSRAAAVAERAFLRRLEGGCQVPIAAHATFSGGEIRLRGLVSSLDGRFVVEDETKGAPDDAEVLGTTLAGELLERGARRILEALSHAEA